MALLSKPHLTENIDIIVVQDSRTPWYQDVRTWVGAASVACLTIFGVFAGKEDDDARVWGVFLGLTLLLGVVELVLIARVNRRLCFAPIGEAVSAGIESGMPPVCRPGA